MKPIVDQGFWSNPEIEGAKSGVKMAALWLFTNARTSLLGICVTTVNRFEFETGLPGKTLEAALQALPRTFQRFEQGIFIRGYIRHQFGTGEKLMRNNFFVALKSAFDAVKDPQLKAAILSEYPELDIQALPRAYQGLAKPKRREDRERKEKKGKVGKGEEPSGATATQPSEPPGSVAVSQPKPTREETQAYGRELGMEVADVNGWYDHFESNGWRVSGATPMQDWRACLRNNSRRKEEFRPRPMREPGPRGQDGAKDDPRNEALLTEWPEWLKARGLPFVEYRRAADFLKTDFHQERKAKATPTNATV